MSESYNDTLWNPIPVPAPLYKPVQNLKDKGEYPDTKQQVLSPVTEDTSWAFTYTPRGVDI
jgi:hypothetical protein